MGEGGLRDLVVETVDGEVVDRVDPARGDHLAIVGEDLHLRPRLEIGKILVAHRQRIPGIAETARRCGGPSPRFT